jgi:hypothetical protein
MPFFLSQADIAVFGPNIGSRTHLSNIILHHTVPTENFLVLWRNCIIGSVQPKCSACLIATRNNMAQLLSVDRWKGNACNEIWSLILSSRHSIQVETVVDAI